MKKIALSLFSRETPSGKPSPKSYPWYLELTEALNNSGYYTIQVGIQKEKDIGAIVRWNDLSAEGLVKTAREIDSYISVDNFFPHLMQYYAPEKRGIVIFSQSNPLIFGYPTNKNLLKDKKYLKNDQFSFWDSTVSIKAAFVSPEIVVTSLKEIL